MNKLLKITLLSLVIVWSTGATIVVNGPAVFPAPAGASWLVTEDFETSGPTTGWTVSGDTPNLTWNSTSSPITGSSSAKTAGRGNSVSAQYDFTATSDLWVYFAHQTLNSVPFMYSVIISDPSSGDALSIGYWGSSNFRFTGGNQDNFPSYTISTATTLYFWLHDTKGTGSNAVGELYVSTTTTKPGSPLSSWTNSNMTHDLSRITLNYSSNGADYKWDYLRVSSSIIGSAP